MPITRYKSVNMESVQSILDDPCFQQYVNAAGYEVCITRDGGDIFSYDRQWLRPIPTNKLPKLKPIDKPQRIFRQFATIASAEACAIFATEYGLLGFTDGRGPNGETVETWLSSAHKAKWALEFWGNIKRRQYRKLDEAFAATDSVLNAMDPAGIPGVYAGMNDAFSGGQLYGIDQATLLKIPAGQGPKRQSERLHIMQTWLEIIASSHLHSSVSAKIHQGRIVSRPLCLMGAMWLGFAAEITGTVDMHVCEYEGCRKWFSRGPGKDRRANAKTCSDKCMENLSNHRRRVRKNAQNAETGL